jgi:hypothetical protein
VADTFYVQGSLLLEVDAIAWTTLLHWQTFLWADLNMTQAGHTAYERHLRIQTHIKRSATSKGSWHWSMLFGGREKVEEMMQSPQQKGSLNFATAHIGLEPMTLALFVHAYIQSISRLHLLLP